MRGAAFTIFTMVVRDCFIAGDRVMVTARGPQIIARADVRLAEQVAEQTLKRDLSLEVTYWRTLTP
jgi:hypothetical protein